MRPIICQIAYLDASNAWTIFYQVSKILRRDAEHALLARATTGVEQHKPWPLHLEKACDQKEELSASWQNRFQLGLQAHALQSTSDTCLPCQNQEDI